MLSRTLASGTQTSPGLSSTEAKRRLEVSGPNEIFKSRLKSRFEGFAKFLLDPMGLMLLGLAALYALVGERTDAIVLLIAWVPVTAVDVVLEFRASAALKALKATLSPFCKVIRDGRISEIPIREVVPGDLLVFEEGQTLPADGRILESQNLGVNESALTGESLPNDKTAGDEFYSGTQVINGRGLGEVARTGQATRFGKIAKMLEVLSEPASPLKRKVDRLVKRVLLVALGLVLLLFGIEMARTGQLIPSLIVAMTFGMSTVPEEFPIVFTLYLSLGAWRLAQKKVLVKSLPCVEALGSADVLCTDKTGTLTEGHFQLETILRMSDFPGEDSVWEAALMACEAHPVDSMEVAIAERGAPYRDRLEDWELVFDYPFEKQGKHMTHVWRQRRSKIYRTVMKGALEGILEHCETTASERAQIENLIQTHASQGKRLLGLAFREGLASGERRYDERGLRFAGILVFSDPLRKSVIDAIARCQGAGIEFKMLTGDHPLTAHTIADQAGIRHTHDQLYTGEVLAKMTEIARREAYIQGAIFSRVLPEQKHELVRTLREDGRIVAMLGDGINDAPALKLADIGISMGRSATDVARSSAQIVLLDSDFSGIVAAMFEGRKILANLRRSFAYLISFHIPVILLALIPPLVGWNPLLLPIHIILLELIVHPVSAFTFENQPAAAGEDTAIGKGALLSSRRIIRAGSAGFLVSFGALTLYFGFGGTEMARSCALITVLIGNIAFVGNEVWPQLNRRFVITIVSLLALALLIITTPLAPLHLANVPWGGVLWACSCGVLGFIPRLIWK